jgi:hypothetical protein
MIWVLCGDSLLFASAAVAGTRAVRRIEFRLLVVVKNGILVG